ncbi:MAG: hypothetical protein AAB853_02570 [Patescibacteria group bacterium]
MLLVFRFDKEKIVDVFLRHPDVKAHRAARGEIFPGMNLDHVGSSLHPFFIMNFKLCNCCRRGEFDRRAVARREEIVR